MGKGRVGSSMTNVVNPKKRKAAARRRLHEEQRWAAKSGPVIIRKIGDPKPGDSS